jgi:hypothetical protein
VQRWMAETRRVEEAKEVRKRQKVPLGSMPWATDGGGRRPCEGRKPTEKPGKFLIFKWKILNFRKYLINLPKPLCQALCPNFVFCVRLSTYWNLFRHYSFRAIFRNHDWHFPCYFCSDRLIMFSGQINKLSFFNIVQNIIYIFLISRFWYCEIYL